VAAVADADGVIRRAKSMPVPKLNDVEPQAYIVAFSLCSSISGRPRIDELMPSECSKASAPDRSAVRGRPCRCLKCKIVTVNDFIELVRLPETVRGSSVGLRVSEEAASPRNRG
jgi:hypothetical protein